MIKTIYAIAGALCLTACASTPSTHASSSKVSDEELVAGILSSEIDLSKTHDIGPISCPNKIAGVEFEKVVNFNPNATNVGCSYNGDGLYYTLYAYDQNGVDLYAELQGVVNTVLIAKKDWKLTYEEEHSQSCAFQALIMGAAVLDEESQGSTIAIDPDAPIGDVNGYNLAMGVLTNDKTISIAAVHSRDNMMFKVRSTAFYEKGYDEGEIFKQCRYVAEAMRALDNGFDASKVENTGSGGTQI